MDPAYISALAALAGATVGGDLVVDAADALRHAHREAQRAYLKALYQGFITDASRLSVEAMSTKTDNIRRCLKAAVASMHTSLNSNHKTP